MRPGPAVHFRGREARVVLRRTVRGIGSQMSLTLVVGLEQTVLLSTHGLNHSHETNNGKKKQSQENNYVFQNRIAAGAARSAASAKRSKALVTQKEPLRLIFSRYSRYFTVKPVAWSRFRRFWVLGAARDKTKETIVEIKVVYDTYKHFISVGCSKQSRYGDFLAVHTVSNGYILVISSQKWVF
jgi:hypothetical protein